MTRPKIVVLVLSMILAPTTSHAAGIIMWPNCVSPGDTIVLKTGGWKDYRYSTYQGLFPIFAGYFFCELAGGGTTARVPVQIDPGTPYGTKSASVYPVGCPNLDPDCTDCESVPGSSPYYCWSATYDVVADTGNPLYASVITTVPRVEVAGQVAYGDTSRLIFLNFIPLNTCNSSPCGAVRVVQAVKPFASIGGGALTHIPY